MNLRITAFWKTTTAGILFLLVSGVLPILIQSYAWIDMAQKAGGLEKIGYAIAEAEPCEICDVAREFSDSQRSGQDVPLPVEVSDFLKGAVVDSTGQLANAAEVQKNSKFPAPGNFTIPQGPDSDSVTPPPRA